MSRWIFSALAATCLFICLVTSIQVSARGLCESHFTPSQGASGGLASSSFAKVNNGLVKTLDQIKDHLLQFPQHRWFAAETIKKLEDLKADLISGVLNRETAVLGASESLRADTYLAIARADAEKVADLVIDSELPPSSILIQFTPYHELLRLMADVSTALKEDPSAARRAKRFILDLHVARETMAHMNYFVLLGFDRFSTRESVQQAIVEQEKRFVEAVWQAFSPLTRQQVQALALEYEHVVSLPKSQRPEARDLIAQKLVTEIRTSQAGADFEQRPREKHLATAHTVLDNLHGAVEMTDMMFAHFMSAALLTTAPRANRYIQVFNTLYELRTFYAATEPFAD